MACVSEEEKNSGPKDMCSSLEKVAAFLETSIAEYKSSKAVLKNEHGLEEYAKIITNQKDSESNAREHPKSLGSESSKASFMSLTSDQDQEEEHNAGESDNDAWWTAAEKELSSESSTAPETGSTVIFHAGGEEENSLCGILTQDMFLNELEDLSKERISQENLSMSDLNLSIGSSSKDDEPHALELLEPSSVSSTENQVLNDRLQYLTQEIDRLRGDLLSCKASASDESRLLGIAINQMEIAKSESQQPVIAASPRQANILPGFNGQLFPSVNDDFEITSTYTPRSGTFSRTDLARTRLEQRIRVRRQFAMKYFEQSLVEVENMCVKELAHVKDCLNQIKDLNRIYFDSYQKAAGDASSLQPSPSEIVKSPDALGDAGSGRELDSSIVSSVMSLPFIKSYSASC